MAGERRNRSRVVRVLLVQGPSPGYVEVYTEEWRSAASNRWFRVWLARKEGATGWQTGRNARTAVRNALFLRKGKRAPYVTRAALAAQRQLAEPSTGSGER